MASFEAPKFLSSSIEADKAKEEEIDTNSKFKMGCMFRMAGRHKSAISLFKSAIDAGMNTAKCRFNYAASLKEVGEVNEALNQFLLAAELDSDVIGISAKGNIAALYILLERPNEAVVVCQELLTLKPFEASVWWNLNTALRQVHRTSEAIEKSWIAFESLAGKKPVPLSFPSSPPPPSSSSIEICEPVVIACLKWGTKYDATSVNRLLRGCKRNLSYGLTFVCLTDDPSGLDPEIRVVVLPPSSTMKGWWYKAYLFSSECFASVALKGSRIVYIDLDTVIVGSLDEIVSYQGCFGTLGTEGFVNERREGGLNTSLMIWTEGTLQEIWSFLQENFENLSKLTYKFDHWIEMLLNDHADRLQCFYPGQICGYAQVMNGINDNHRFVTFPLSPKPWQVDDDWVIRHWKMLLD